MLGDYKGNDCLRGFITYNNCFLFYALTDLNISVHHFLNKLDNHLYFIVSIIFTIFKLFNLDILDKPYNHLYICYSSIHIMSLNQEQKVISRGGVPVVAIGALIAIALFSLWVVGYDVGQIFSVVQGKPAYNTMWLHEFVHDIRHESGFPCH